MIFKLFDSKCDRLRETVKWACALWVSRHSVYMSNSIDSSRESNPSRKMCNVRAVPVLGYMSTAWQSKRALTTKIISEWEMVTNGEYFCLNHFCCDVMTVSTFCRNYLSISWKFVRTLPPHFSFFAPPPFKPLSTMSPAHDVIVLKKQN